MNADRFLAFVEVSTSGCWEWHGPKKPSGACMYNTSDGSRVRAVRYAFEMENGRPPRRLRCVCGNHLCVRPGKGHWEETVRGKPVETVRLRGVDEMTPAEIAEFKFRYFRMGSRPESLGRYFNLTPIGLQRAVERYTRAA